MFYPILEMIPEDIQNELKQNYNALCELLRHFWSCFPASSKFLEEKVGSSIIIICSLLCAMLVYYIMCSFLKLEYLLSLLLLLLLYYPFLLTCQMHTDYTVRAHDILIFEPFSVVFVKCTDINKQLDVFIV